MVGVRKKSETLKKWRLKVSQALRPALPEVYLRKII